MATDFVGPAPTVAQLLQNSSALASDVKEGNNNKDTGLNMITSRRAGTESSMMEMEDYEEQGGGEALRDTGIKAEDRGGGGCRAGEKDRGIIDPKYRAGSNNNNLTCIQEEEAQEEAAEPIPLLNNNNIISRSGASGKIRILDVGGRRNEERLDDEAFGMIKNPGINYNEDQAGRIKEEEEEEDGGEEVGRNSSASKIGSSSRQMEFSESINSREEEFESDLEGEEQEGQEDEELEEDSETEGKLMIDANSASGHHMSIGQKIKEQAHLIQHNLSQLNHFSGYGQGNGALAGTASGGIPGSISGGNRPGSASRASEIFHSSPSSSRPSSASPRGSPSSLGSHQNTILNMMKEKNGLVNGYHHQSNSNRENIFGNSQQHNNSVPSSALSQHHHNRSNPFSPHLNGGEGVNKAERHQRSSSSHDHHFQRNHHRASDRTGPMRDHLKHERRASRSPLHDGKTENVVAPPVGGLGGASLGNNFNASIGNALLNLASLGGLASFPNLLSSSLSNAAGNSGSPSGGGGNSNDIQRSITNLLSQQQNLSATASAMSALAALHGSSSSPLNLTSGGNPGGTASPALGSAHLAQLISQQQQQQQAQQTSNSFLGNNSGGGSSGGMPQLLLASGQIIQGIQGAQLLIPTSQGLVAQSILAIPLAQPGSPPAGIFPPAGSPQLPNQSQTLSHGGGVSGSGRLHHGPGNGREGRDRPSSPKIAQILRPSSNSPDFMEHHPNTSLPPPPNLGGHSIGSQLGAHIPLMGEKLDHQHRNSMNGIRERNINGPTNNNLNSHNNNNNSSSSSSNNNNHHHHHHGGVHHHHHSSMGGMSIDRRESGFPALVGNSRGISSSSSSSTLLPQPKLSPCSPDSGDESDKFSDNDDSDQMVDGINLDEIKEFAKAFKLRRLSLGLTQTQVGQALSVTEGPAYSQSAICSALAWQLAQSQNQSNRTTIPQPSMFEKLDITPKSAQKIKPVLERWMKEAEERYKHGHQNLNEFVGMEPSKKRKRRTSFTPQALEILNTHFERNTHPSGAEITTLAHQLGYEREVIRIWFCNKRQALKNTVRMMSKGSSPV